MLSALPDHTPGELKHPKQGDKWKTLPLFAHLMVTYKGQDYWVDDLVQTTCKTGNFAISGFHASGSAKMVKGFTVPKQDIDHLIEEKPDMINIEPVVPCMVRSDYNVPFW
ncbi:hypothetical protein [Absidia glauca]|uniref:Uncharacterized protein n=1 Tax=Absidia glauca TaxID=4829 RepID=A0A168NJ62_ABSGL|nr:hypothetical protein [Absidia glauca]